MAIIYQKAVGEQNLILSPREALIYPFNVGTWNELRVGYFYSWTTDDNDNAAFETETISDQHLYIRNSAYWGLKDSSTIMPSVVGSRFIGIGTHPIVSTSTHVLQQRTVVGIETFGGSLKIASNGSAMTTLFMVDGTGVTTNNLGNFGYSTDINRTTNSTNYNYFYTQRYVKDTVGGKTTIHYSHYHISEDSAYDAATLRSRQFNLSVASYSSSRSGYYTSDFSAGGTNETLPDSIFIYMPFLNNRIRISALVVEKIA